jgi:hypothetical protein
MARAASPDGQRSVSLLGGACRALSTLLLLAVLAVSGTAAGAPSAPLPRVTMIGDSVAAAVQLEPGAMRILGQAIDLNPQLAVCRRLTGESCPYNGARPPTLVDLAATLGPALGRTVIVAVGYNDSEQTYAQDIEESLDALHKAGVERVLWTTLHAERQSYVAMNGDIRAAAERHPEMTVVDWNVYSRSHPDWFQADGLHLGYSGAVALATLLHKTLVDLEVAAAPRVALVVSPGKLPVGHVGRSYSVRLGVRGGTAPYHWSTAGALLPRGLRLQASGRIIGRPALPGRTTLRLKVTDAKGRSAVRRLVLTIAT